MLTLTVVLLAAVAGTSGYLIKVPVAPISQTTLAPSVWIHLQKLVLPLFENVCELSTDSNINRLSQEFSSTISAGDFWDTEVITKFQNFKSEKGFLPKGQIFSEYNIEHTNELKIVFDVMCNAKTFDTFYKIAAWSRQNLNCGLYVNLIYMAMENRRDTEKLTLPPPYELLPNYFIRKDIIIQGSSLLAGEEFTPSEGVRDEGNAYTLDANYTANSYDNDDESKLAYFREDIGLNSYYFLNMLKWTPWLNKDLNINSRYGEEMYHMMKQLVARYNLERYANGLPEQDELNWDSLSDAPYDPMLVYSNGNEFIHRTLPVQLPENEDKALLLTIENNIVTVVSHMRDAGYNKTQILNHLIEILVTGERSYDSLARHLLGKVLSNNGQPTVFEHYMTSLRDPMIWKMYNKIVTLIDEALKVLPSYTKTELYFPGVEIISVDVKKIMTNFDYFEFDITEALKIGNGDTTFQVKIGQARLNHKPFVMKLNISSLVTQKGLLKIYLGPKMMPGEFVKKKNMLNLLDSFELNLQKGTNIVTKNSNDMKMFASDFTSLKTLYKKVEEAQFGLDSLPSNTIEKQISFPERLIIPKGTSEGLPLQLFVFVAPIMKATFNGAYLTPNLEFNPSVLSPLYPLDLMMEERILLDLPNALIKDLTVTHKSTSGAKKAWNDKSNGPPPRPNVYNKGNEFFDYKAKKGIEQDEKKINGEEFLRPNTNYYEVERNDDELLTSKSRIQETSGFDYSNSKYDYKSRPFQYDKTGYLSKKVDYKALYQDKTTITPVDEVNKDKSMNEAQAVDNSQKEYFTTNDLHNVDQSVDDLNNYMQNDDPSLGVKHYLLKSSGSDYTQTSEQTDILDDKKYKRPKIVMPNYKKIYKNIWKTTESPVDNMDKKSELVKSTIHDDENVVGSMQNEKNNKFFEVTDDVKLDSPSENNYVVYMEDVDSLKKLNNHDYLTKKDNKLVAAYDTKDLNKENYFKTYEDDSNEKIAEIIPAANSPSSKMNTFHKYLLHLMEFF